ncbi:hypothetical protein NVP2275O_198 [Vibrio phage 2.275.O._10N.286.54.E11]|nr:hypothetical protein NVP2275O_198 [Vibrio phage 2.275.O._10N.286.54.E11]
MKFRQYYAPHIQNFKVQVHIEVDEISLMTLELLGLDGKTYMWFDNYRYGDTASPLVGLMITPNYKEPEWMELDDVFDEETKNLFLLNLEMEMSDKGLSY